MVGFAVIVGIAVVSNDYKEIFTLTSLFGFLTGFLISSFSMISNDIYDIGVDRINQPTRPIVSGRVSLQSAKILSAAFIVSGLGASVILGPANLAIAGVFAFIGWYYNFHGKKPKSEVSVNISL